MKSFLGIYILLLTILLRMEFFVLDGVLAYDSNQPSISNTEWVLDEEIPSLCVLKYTEGYDSVSSIPSHSNFSFISTFYIYLQPLYYPEKLQLSDGYIFVTHRSCRSNIPHRNSDDEDPAFLLG